MKTKTHIKQTDLRYAPQDGARYIIILHDGRKLKAKWNAGTSCFHLDGETSAAVRRMEAFDWWPASV